MSKEKKEYVIIFDDGTYWCGYNQTDKQLRKAKIYTSLKMAVSVAKECIGRKSVISRNDIQGYKILEVELKVIGEYCSSEKKSCFWCEHLILDGMNSWCDIHRAGDVCKDYKENVYRINRCKELSKTE